MPQRRFFHIQSATAHFRGTLGNGSLNKLARATGFVQRQRKVTALSIVVAFLVTLGGQSAGLISDVLRTLNEQTEQKLKYKPFWNRLAKRSFVAFMRGLFEQLCQEMSLRILECAVGGRAKPFSVILIDDGCSFALADGLRHIFPGRFTKIKPAAVELHAHMNLLTGNLQRVTLAPDKEAERQFLPAPESLPKNSLSLRDRGYMDVPYLERLNKHGAFLIYRARTDINPTIVRVVRGMPPKKARSWEGKRLQGFKSAMPRRDVELVVCWPRPEGRSCDLRLVIRYNPPKPEAPKRIRTKGKTKQRSTSESWTWLLTNLPASTSAWAVGQLYRLRWQIELVFKELKSYANLHALQSEQPQIVEGFIWASLCVAFLKRAVAHMAQLLLHRPVSTQLVAMAGPHIVRLLADWIRFGFRPHHLDRLLTFILGNALPTHPERNARAPATVLGLRPITHPLDALLGRSRVG